MAILVAKPEPKSTNSKMTNDISQKSLTRHKEARGKLAVISRVPLETREDLALAYTPGVAVVSEAIGRDKTLAYVYTSKGNSVAVVTDGSAILGLGNLGPEAALPVMEGKAILFKKFADIDAWPICLASQEVDEIVQAVKMIAPSFGGINLEDISAPRCFEVEDRLKKDLDIPVMHDDQHGTATVVLAGLINALKLKNLNKDEAKVVINGAGAAGVAITKLLFKYGFKQIIVCDSRGAINKTRADLNESKKEIADLTDKFFLAGQAVGNLSEALVGADIFVGVSVGGILTVGMIKTMNSAPIIFAMANPIPEIMPDLAKQSGAYIVATGRSDFPNQINNVLAFPGIFRGALDHQVKQITDEMLIGAAENLANFVTDLSPEKILPDPFEPGIAKIIAKDIIKP